MSASTGSGGVEILTGGAALGSAISVGLLEALVDGVSVGALACSGTLAAVFLDWEGSQPALKSTAHSRDEKTRRPTNCILKRKNLPWGNYATWVMVLRRKCACNETG